MRGLPGAFERSLFLLQTDRHPQGSGEGSYAPEVPGPPSSSFLMAAADPDGRSQGPPLTSFSSLASDPWALPKSSGFSPARSTYPAADSQGLGDGAPFSFTSQTKQ